MYLPWDPTEAAGTVIYAQKIYPLQIWVEIEISRSVQNRLTFLMIPTLLVIKVTLLQCGHIRAILPCDLGLSSLRNIIKPLAKADFQRYLLLDNRA